MAWNVNDQKNKRIERIVIMAKKDGKKKGGWFSSNRLMEEIKQLADSEANLSEKVPHLENVEELKSEIDKKQIQTSVQDAHSNHEQIKKELNDKTLLVKTQEDTLAKERHIHQNLQNEYDHLSAEHHSTLEKMQYFENEKRKQEEALEKEQAEINAKLADGTLFVSNNDQAMKLSARLAAIDEQLLEKLERWETLENLSKG